MKKSIMLILLCLLMAGCASPSSTEGTMVPTTETSLQIANPWKRYETLAEAEAAVGFLFPMPEVIADSYTAESFRVMNEQLLEVIYRDSTFEVTVRMQNGEGQDLSGIYGEFQNIQTFEVDGASITVMHIDGGIVQLISKDGYSYSLHAPNHYWGDSNIEFLQYIYDAK